MRTALRRLARERAFTGSVVCLIALGVGLVTTMFALVDAIVLRPLDVADPGSLLQVVAIKEGRPSSLPYSAFERLRENPDIAETWCATSNTFLPVAYRDRSVTVFALFVAGEYYRVMSARPLLGRALTEDDEGPVAVISDALWRRLGADPRIVGQPLRAGGLGLTIVGVMPAEAHQNWRFVKADLVVPLQIGIALEGAPAESVSRYPVFVAARLRPATSLANVQARLDALWPRLVADTVPAGQNLDEWARAAGKARALPGDRGISGMDDTLPRAAKLLFALAVVVVLAMCSTVGGLLLARGVGRETEYAVRVALGATRSDLLRDRLMEVGLFSAFGTAGAALLAAILTRACSKLLVSTSPFGLQGIDYGVRIDGRVLVFALMSALATAAAAHVLPALRCRRAQLVDSLRAGSATISTPLRGRKVLVALQVASATVLVTGSILLIQTVRLLTGVPHGFQADHVLVATIAGIAPAASAPPESFRELLRRIRTIPGVTAAGLGERAPMEWQYDKAEPIRAIGASAAQQIRSDSGCVWPGFFEVFGIPVIAGRDFRDSDRAGIVLTNELALHLFGTNPPLGRHVRVGEPSGSEPQGRDHEIIGIVGDVRFRSLRQQDTRMFFVPCPQMWSVPQTAYSLTLGVRGAGSPAEIDLAVRREVDRLGMHWVFQTTRLERLVADSARTESLLAAIATVFGAFVLVFTCAGMYALLDLMVAARRRELGIRMALGADEQRILHLFLNDISRMIAAGVGAGLLVTAGATRVYRAILFGIAPLDPFLLSTAVAIVVLSVLAAALVPAWRARRLAPASLLRMG